MNLTVNQDKDKSLSEIRQEQLEELAKDLFYVDDDTGHLYFKTTQFCEFSKALFLQLLDEDSIGEEKSEDEYELSSLAWANKYFKKIDSIFKNEEVLARYVKKLRARYEPTKRDIQKSRKKNWSASLLRILVFSDNKQWLKSNKIRYKWVCELFGTDEISEATFKTLKKDYVYFG